MQDLLPTSTPGNWVILTVCLQTLWVLGVIVPVPVDFTQSPDQTVVLCPTHSSDSRMHLLQQQTSLTQHKCHPPSAVLASLCTLVPVQRSLRRLLPRLNPHLANEVREECWNHVPRPDLGHPLAIWASAELLWRYAAACHHCFTVLQNACDDRKHCCPAG
eukprot:GHUV01039714.1.p1 GENE.GHUV01039714.1~~GHUV01039714.1.p1  ORF type:complete len:160 (+),score=8.34 GHUV01039714.1:203-682(+)